MVHVVTDSYGFEICNLSDAADDESCWKRISGPWEVDLDDRPFNPLNFRWKNPVSINGHVLYWYVDSSKYIISMQVNEAKFSRTYFPRLVPVEVIKRYELVELGGILSFVYCDSDIRMDVWILEGQCWSKKHSIVAESINYISPKNVKSLEKYETSMPDIGKLVPIGGVRNDGVSILKHKNSNIYVYDTNTRVMKKVSINMKNIGTFIPYKDGLFSMNSM